MSVLVLLALENETHEMRSISLLKIALEQFDPEVS